MITEIIITAFLILIVLSILLLPILVGAFISERWNKLILGVTTMIVLYVLMVSTVVVIGSSELTGTGEVIGMEYVPAHNESSIRTQPTVINGKISIITLPSNEYKEEAYVIHVRKKTDSKYKRYMLEVSKEEFEKFNLGQEIDLGEYEKYD